MGFTIIITYKCILIFLNCNTERTLTCSLRRTERTNTQAFLSLETSRKNRHLFVPLGTERIYTYSSLGVHRIRRSKTYLSLEACFRLTVKVSIYFYTLWLVEQGPHSNSISKFPVSSPVQLETFPVLISEIVAIPSAKLTETNLKISLEKSQSPISLESWSKKNSLSFPCVLATFPNSLCFP